MIPYDDLVNALTAWRARQGLPVADIAAPVTASPTPRTTPPPAPRGFGASPPPLEPAEEPMDVDDAALLEEAHYENQGDDFAMAFGNVQSDGESTAIGGPPVRDSFGAGGTDPEPAPPSRKRGRGW